MKTILSLLLLLSQTLFASQKYYFDASSGNDAALSNSKTTPWKTIAKLNSISLNIKPGDAILFKRGETFYGTITINTSGTALSPIIIGAYGDGEAPVITGLVPLTWASAGNNLWTTNEALQSTYLNMLTVNGIPAGMGRWPNLDNGNGGYDTIRSGNFESITDEIGLTTAPSPGEPTYFIGAEIVVRSQRWLLDRHPVTDYNSGNSTIKFDPLSMSGVGGSNMGYFIQDDSTVLDRQNEWWYNRSNKTVKIYADNSPKNVSAANLENLFTSLNNSYITIEDITFNGCNEDAVSIMNGSNIIIQNCTLQNIGRNAIATTTAACSFLNNKITDVMSKGIWLKPGAVNTIIRHNVMRNISQIPGLGTSQLEDGQQSYSGDGVYIKENSAIIEYNSFVNIGYAAVHLTKVDSAIIRYNFIDTVCNVYDDGGGIYSYTGDPFTNYGRRITNNIILHGIGAFYGSGVDSNATEGAAVAGIYNDRNSSDIEIDSNTVAYFDKGIFMNYGSKRLTITQNNLYNNLKGIQINTRSQDGDITRKLHITGNISLAATTAQNAMYLYSDDGDGINTFGIIDSNYYARPIDDTITMIWQTNQGSQNIHYGSLANWQSVFPSYDAHSKKGSHPITKPYQLTFTYNSTNKDKSIPLSGNYEDIKGNTSSNSIMLRPFTSVVLIKSGGSAHNEPPTVSITSPSANANFTAPASINLTAVATDSDGSIATVKFYNGTTLLGTQHTSPYAIKWDNVPAGKYSLTAVATDNDSLTTISTTINVSVTNSNIAPKVSITSPVNNASFTAPASINLTAIATDSDGSIATVKFYNGTTLLGTQHTSPYAIKWDNVPAGKYSLTAVATDNDSLTTISTTINVSVTNSNIAPKVSITSPVNNAGFTAPASINLTAIATDVDGSIATVKFYNGTTLLGTQHTSPYNITWHNVPVGKYSITAIATDNGGLSTTSTTINVSVKNPDIAPQVYITSPSATKNFTSPASIDLSAVATDADGTIAKVEFYNGTTLLGTQYSSPYNITWHNVPVGKYSITAVATDNDSVSTTSAIIKVAVTNPDIAPQVYITSPSATKNFTSPASIDLSAVATDADGTIAKVEFYNGTTLLGTQYSSPYNITWHSVPVGKYSITAVATDNDSVSTTSAVIKVSVTESKVPPEVSITSPSTKENFPEPASIRITATATDADGTIAKVEFYNGSTLLFTDETAPYSELWESVPTGNYVITAVATDNDGLKTTSEAVHVNVLHNRPPVVKITSPADSSTYQAPATIKVSADAVAHGGKIKVIEFYNGTTLIHTEVNPPYLWNWKKVAEGNYTMTAKAIDNYGRATISSPVTIIVTPKASLESRSSSSDIKAALNVGVSLQLSPNPAHGILNIYTSGLQTNKQSIISIISSSGVVVKVLQTSSSVQATQLNVSSLTSGMYFIKIISGDKVMYKQFVKM